MSDDMNMAGVAPVEPQPGSAGAKKAKAGAGGFFSSPVGRIVLIGGGLAVILAIVAVVVVLVLGTFATGSGGGSGITPPVTPASGETSGAVSTVPTAPPAVPDIATRDVFTPRDPFEEIQPPVIPTETVKVDANVLVLKDIITEDGVRKGVFSYNGVEYTGGQGEQLGDTNWKVLAVHDSSADVLYGDDRITLSIGQGIQK